MSDYYTENLADFGYRELEMLRDLLDAWITLGLPEDFEHNKVKPAFNKASGYVFLINDDYQVAMMNGKNLESFYTSPYDGREGFFNDLLPEFLDMHPEDQDWLRNIAENLGREDELPELLPADSYDEFGVNTKNSFNTPPKVQA